MHLDMSYIIFIIWDSNIWGSYVQVLFLIILFFFDFVSSFLLSEAR